jgi:hypothetical protein
MFSGLPQLAPSRPATIIAFSANIAGVQALRARGLLSIVFVLDE